MPACRTLRVEPQWVRAHLDTPRGRVAVEWRRGAVMIVDVPLGVSAEVAIAGTRTAVPAGSTRLTLGGG